MAVTQSRTEARPDDESNDEQPPAVGDVRSKDDEREFDRIVSRQPFTVHKDPDTGLLVASQPNGSLEAYAETVPEAIANLASHYAALQADADDDDADTPADADD